jgi:K+/H+ antiporter YhaU regulatory subunit KhtT
VLSGKTLAEAAIPSETQCNIVALRTEKGLLINPEPSQKLEAVDELILICTPDGEERFLKRYGSRPLIRKPIAPTANVT